MPSAAQIAWAKFRVLATAVAGLVIVSVLVYLLGRGTLFRRTYILRTYVSDSTGITRNSPVRLNGVLVGHVQAVALSALPTPESVVEVRLAIRGRFLEEIPADSTTDISAETMIGDRFINITKGKSPRHAQPGAALLHLPETGIMSRVDIATFTNKLRDVDALLRDIQAGRGPTGELVQGETMYREMLDRVSALQRDVEALADMKRLSGRMLYGLEEYGDIERPLLRLDRQLASLQQGEGALGRFLKDPGSYDDLRRQFTDLQRAVREYRAGPFVSSDAQYRAWNRGLASLIGRVDAFQLNPTLSSSQVYESLNGSAHAIQSVLRDFRSNPRKFLRLNLDVF